MIFTTKLSVLSIVKNTIKTIYKLTKQKIYITNSKIKKIYDKICMYNQTAFILKLNKF